MSDLIRQGEEDPLWRSADGKVVVVGLGNVYMRDDGVGIRALAELRKLELGDGVLLYDYTEMDLSLVSYFGGASRVIVVDALRAGLPPGTVSKFMVKGEGGPVSHLNLHELQFYEVFDLAIQAGILTCPVVIVGVEPKDWGVGEGLTQELETALPGIVGAVADEAREGVKLLPRHREGAP